MMKWIVGLLLLANLAIFSWMRWGHVLTVDTDAVATQAALNPEKIKLMDLQSPSAAASAPSGALALTPATALAVGSAPSAPVVSAVSQMKGASCAEWGEFSGSDLTRAQQALALLKLGERLSQRNVEHNHGYWVYIPPLKRRVEVERKLAQLKERGVKDYFVVQDEGKWQNAISLGVFKTEEAAQKFLASLRTKGVRTAKVGERMSKLKFVVFVMKGLDADTVAKLGTLQKEFAGSELNSSACSN